MNSRAYQDLRKQRALSQSLWLVSWAQHRLASCNRLDEARDLCLVPSLQRKALKLPSTPNLLKISSNG